MYLSLIFFEQTKATICVYFEYSDGQWKMFRFDATRMLDKIPCYYTYIIFLKKTLTNSPKDQNVKREIKTLNMTGFW